MYLHECEAFAAGAVANHAGTQRRQCEPSEPMIKSVTVQTVFTIIGFGAGPRKGVHKVGHLPESLDAPARLVM